MAYAIQGETFAKAGKPPRPNQFHETETCVEGVLISNGNELKFKFDNNDLEKVKSRHWFAATGGKYIATYVVINNEKKTLYLHNFIMNRIVFPGKGAKESIDHINRDGLDNRKENLRLVTQTEQNINQKKKDRRVNYPEGITELPTHVWYVKANGAHGDRFCIEFKSENFKWRGTSSKAITIHDKLKQTVEQLVVLYQQYPHLKKDLTSFLEKE
jgi:hypothetical protein